MRFFLKTALAAAGIALFANASYAKPEYAMKEKKPCGYCHTNPMGGGARNPRGNYYEKHQHTFIDYDEAKVMGTAAVKKSGPPAFKTGWKIEVPATTKRIAVADVTSDKMARLLLLDDHKKLTINKVNGEKVEEEGAVELGEGAEKFTVGHFAKGKPAVIVVPGAVYYRDGDKYSKKAAADLTDITGNVRFTDGTENVFYFSGAQPDVYGVDLAADKPLTAGKEMVQPSDANGVYAEITIHPPVELLGLLGIPEQGQKTGVMGIFDPRSEGKVYIWVPWVEAGGTTIKVAPLADISADVKPLWESPKLAGKVLDVAFGSDPKNSKVTGLFVLSSTEDGKKRVVEFFALD